MARRGRRSLPRSVQKSLAPTQEAPIASTFAPLNTSQNILQKRVEVVRPPDPNQEPPVEEEPVTALVPQKPGALLQQMGAQVLLGGQQGQGTSEFWIQLSDHILGGLEIRLHWEQGFLKATLIARSVEIREQLQKRMPQLMALLQTKGLRVGELSVELRESKKRVGTLPSSAS